MRVGVMITDGGPHSASDWAEQTASQIIEISSSAPEGKIAEAKAFRERLVTLLAGHHARVQVNQRSNEVALQNHSSAVDDARAAILSAASGSSFESHFAQEGVQNYLSMLLLQHFNTIAYIERSWAKDRAEGRA